MSLICYRAYFKQSLGFEKEAQCGKNNKFTLTERIFRQINSLETYLVKSLLSRNFCQKEDDEISVNSTQRGGCQSVDEKCLISRMIYLLSIENVCMYIFVIP